MNEIIGGQSALSTALQGIQKAESRLADAAERVATSFSGTGSDSGLQALTDMKLAELDVKANAKVLKTVSDLEDSILAIA